MSKIDKKTIAIMRPTQHLEKSIALAENFGFKAIAAPMIEIIDLKDEKFENFVSKIIESKSNFVDFVIFTSVNGIKWTLTKLREEARLQFIDGLKSLQVISIGPITKNALMKLGVKSMIPDDGDYSSDGLSNYLCPKIQGKSIFIARSFYGSKSLIPNLEKCGANVFETVVYSLAMPYGDAQKILIQEAISGNIEIFPFTSSMMVHNFFKCLKKYDLNMDIKEVLKDSIVAAIGKPTAISLKQYGIEVDFTPSKCTFEALIEEIAMEIENKNF